MVIKNGFVFLRQGSFVSQPLYIDNGKIVEHCEGNVLDASGKYVIPGLIDIHFHGCVGYDFCDGTKEALANMAEYQLRNGVTTICPTSMTFSEEILEQVFANAAAYENSKGATLAGIHMEGPFLSAEKKGAQNEKFLHVPDADMFFRLQTKARGLIKICDIAPELDGAMECIEAIKEAVRVSLAHTAADYSVAVEAFQKGAKQVTHLYNAMKPYTHREPGVIGAACDNDNVMVELICDGVHNHPATVRTTFKMFGDERIIFISDSMRACGMEDGEYTLGGQEVIVQGNQAILKGIGSIAGSVTNLMQCMRIAVRDMGIPLESAIKCVTINPAKALGLQGQYGSLDIGMQADVLILDSELEICSIIKAGEIVYSK